VLQRVNQRSNQRGLGAGVYKKYINSPSPAQCNHSFLQSVNESIFKTLSGSELNADDYVNLGITGKADAVSLSGYTNQYLLFSFWVINKIISSG